MSDAEIIKNLWDGYVWSMAGFEHLRISRQQAENNIKASLKDPLYRGSALRLVDRWITSLNMGMVSR